MVPRRRPGHLITYIEAVLVFLVLLALIALSIRLATPAPYHGNEDGMGAASHSQRLPAELGIGVLKLTVEYPMRLKVNDEEEILVTVEIEGSGLQRLPERTVTITAVASGLTLKPSASVQTTMHNLGAARFIASTAAPGVRILSVRMDTKDFGEIEGLETTSLRINAFQNTDWISKLAPIAQALGIPALIVLVAAEIIRRKSSAGSPPT